MTGKWKAYIASEQGNTAIEFAFVLPVLLLFIFGILEFGFVIFQSATLQGALSTAAREGGTGYPDVTDPGNQCTGASGCQCPPPQCQINSLGAATNAKNQGVRWLKVQSILQSQTQGLFNPNELIFTATAYPDFVALQQAMSGGGGIGGTHNDVGKGGQVVLYTAQYPSFSILSPLLGLSSGGAITAYEIVRNEGF